MSVYKYWASQYCERTAARKTSARAEISAKIAQQTQPDHAIDSGAKIIHMKKQKKQKLKKAKAKLKKAKASVKKAKTKVNKLKPKKGKKGKDKKSKSKKKK